MGVKKLTIKQQDYRKKLLARVHLAPIYRDYFSHYKGEYKNMLFNAFGKKSAADLSINQLTILVKFLVSKTATETNNLEYQNSTPKTVSKSSNVVALANVKTDTVTPLETPSVALVEHISSAQIKYINRLWKQKARNPTQQALRAFIESNFKKIVLNLNALTKKEASGLINALNRM